MTTFLFIIIGWYLFGFLTILISSFLFDKKMVLKSPCTVHELIEVFQFSFLGPILIIPLILGLKEDFKDRKLW